MYILSILSSLGSILNQIPSAKREKIVNRRHLILSRRDAESDLTFIFRLLMMFFACFRQGDRIGEEGVISVDFRVRIFVSFLPVVVILEASLERMQRGDLDFLKRSSCLPSP